MEKPKGTPIVDERGRVWARRDRKSKFWAYLLWLLGGFLGAHHLYLGRDAHAFVYITTFGGYLGAGWLRDLFKIPSYVAEANEDPAFLEDFKRKVRLHRKPPFSTIRFLAAITVSYLWAELYSNAIPQEEIYGINFRHLLVLTPAVIALGVWTVGNIGTEQGSIWSALVSAYASYPSLYYITDETMWLFFMIVASTLTFDAFVVTDSTGEEVKLSDAIKHFLTSPIWLDLKVSLEATWNQAKSQGFWATWAQLVDLTDPRGEINAYKVLGLSQTASQTEVTSRWRTLSRDNHPDKVKGSEEERRKAQEKFMEIQQAYEILSMAKNRRQRRNRRSAQP
ncbi:hypothetical protein KM043_010530 [Ampulex compressa]|nr:hypothetical protein KM043_010530 [Ampulex compressa]